MPLDNTHNQKLREEKREIYSQHYVVKNILTSTVTANSRLMWYKRASEYFLPVL